ncbi:MAG: hypothetical protein LKJ13_05140 [Clostridia bacterium]|nr:hypothetical protein [Clostridia bacterium]MCI1999670.1 hypothetical protein [Clostridia bacterium]MCI2013951.1 hypothetical protein [Clostridia bacterium]
MKKMRKFFILILSVMFCMGTFCITSYADTVDVDNLSNVKNKIIDFITQCDGKSKYVSSDKTENESQKEFVEDAWKYIYGTDLTIPAAQPKYGMGSLKTISEKAECGDVIVFTKNEDSYYMLYTSGDHKDIEYYDINIFPYTKDVDLYKGDDSKFMDGRFKDGTFVILHSKNYKSINHIHSYNKDGYCSCGKPKNGTITDCNEKKYVAVLRGRVYSLPYTGSNIVAIENPSAYPINVTGYTTNLEGQLWYRVDNGWIIGTSLSDKSSSGVSFGGDSLGFTGIINKDSVFVKSHPMSGCVSLGELKKEDTVQIKKKVLSWYQIVFDTKDNTNVGYVLVKDIDVSK